MPLEIQSSLLNDMSDAFSGEVSVDGLPRFELSVRDNDGNLVLLEALDCCGVSADGLRSALSEIVRAKL